MTARSPARNWRTIKDADRLALIKKIALLESIPTELKSWAENRLFSNYLGDRMKDRLERLILSLNMKEVWETVTAKDDATVIEFAGLALSLIEEWDGNYGAKVTNTEIDKAITDVNKAASRLAELILEHKKTIEHFTDVRLEIPKLARLHESKSGRRSVYLNEIDEHVKTNGLDRYFPSLEGILETLANELSGSIKRRTPLKKPKDKGACRRFCIERLSIFFRTNFEKPYDQLVADTINTMFGDVIELQPIDAKFVSDVTESLRADG